MLTQNDFGMSHCQWRARQIGEEDRALQWPAPLLSRNKFPTTYAQASTPKSERRSLHATHCSSSALVTNLCMVPAPCYHDGILGISMFSICIREHMYMYICICIHTYIKYEGVGAAAQGLATGFIQINLWGPNVIADEFVNKTTGLTPGPQRVWHPTSKDIFFRLVAT